MQTIKNCPNCGCMGMLRTKRKSNINFRFWVECADCWTETNKYHTTEDAIEEWNNIPKADVRVNEYTTNKNHTPSLFECEKCGWEDWDTYTGDGFVY